jgi:hypothetical protein
MDVVSFKVLTAVNFQTVVFRADICSSVSFKVLMAVNFQTVVFSVDICSSWRDKEVRPNEPFKIAVFLPITPPDPDLALFLYSLL